MGDVCEHTGKRCTRCGIEKSLDEFHYHKRDGYIARCRSCVYDSSKAWREANPERVRLLRRAENRRKRFRDRDAGITTYSSDLERRYKLRTRYGLTPDMYAEMFQAQGGVCKVCGSTSGRRKNLDVDHCHTTGRVRGLLCNQCNIVLHKNFTPERLRLLAQYLDNAG